jgi:hypothetical protein
MLKLLPVLALAATIVAPAVPSMAQDAEVDSFWIETRPPLKRTDFLSVDNAYWLALVLDRGLGGKTQKHRAQLAGRFAPLQPGNCRVVQATETMGDSVWLMLNNAPVDDETAEKVLRVRVDHYSLDPGENGRRALVRSQKYEDIKFKVNANIGVEDDAVARVVFGSYIRSSAAIRLTVDAIGDQFFDERVAGSYLLILDHAVLDDGYFPECRRRKANFLGWGRFFQTTQPTHPTLLRR